MTDESAENISENSESDTSQYLVNKKVKVSTELAVKLRTSANLSLSQTVKVLKVLHETFSDDRFLPPTRSAINKASNNAEIEGINRQGLQILRFDGKTFLNLYGEAKIELIAICLNSKLIGLKQVANKKAVTIYETITNVLMQEEISPDIIVSDTEPTNTGRHNGVITKLIRDFPLARFEPCRMHVLDLVLKHQFSLYFTTPTTSSNLPYKFVQNMQSDWKKLREDHLQQCKDYEAPEEKDLPSKEERRKDYKFLLQLVKTVRWFRSSKEKCCIHNFPKQPVSSSNARWNSRAIYSLLAELCNVGDERNTAINNFIIEVRFSSFYIRINFTFTIIIFQRCGLQLGLVCDMELIGIS